jgi:hypothetical protein
VTVAVGDTFPSKSGDIEPGGFETRRLDSLHSLG